MFFFQTDLRKKYAPSYVEIVGAYLSDVDCFNTLRGLYCRIVDIRKVAGQTPL